MTNYFLKWHFFPNYFLLYRYGQFKPPKMPTCKHEQIKTSYMCKRLNSNDLDKFAKGFYKIPTKQAQDTFILTYCGASALSSNQTSNKYEQKKYYNSISHQK